MDMTLRKECAKGNTLGQLKNVIMENKIIEKDTLGLFAKLKGEEREKAINDISSIIKTYNLPKTRIKDLIYLQVTPPSHYTDDIKDLYLLVDKKARELHIDFKDVVIDTLVDSPSSYEISHLFEETDAPFKREIPNVFYLINAIYFHGSEEKYRQLPISTLWSKWTKLLQEDLTINYGIEKMKELLQGSDVSDEINRELSNMPPESYIPVLGEFGLNEVEKEYTPIEDYDLAIENFII